MIDTLYLIGFSIVQAIADLTGLDYTTAWYICIFLFAYILILSICLRINIIHHKKYLETEKNLTFDIDWIRYSYARVLHAHPGAIAHVHQQHQRHIGLINYLQNGIQSYAPYVENIRDDIKHLEKYVQTVVVPDNVWKKIDTLVRQLPGEKSSVASLVKILTLGLYR